jgi:hypothetical protein
MVLIW